MGGVVGDVISFIGRPFGIYTHNETFTEVQILDLLTPGESDKSARRAAVKNSGGDSSLYHKAYRTYQRQYKRRYSSKFLESVGYNPSNTATSRVINDPSLITYLQTTLGYTTVVLNEAKDLYLSSTNKKDYGIQFVTGYNHLTGAVTILGLTYEFSAYEEISDTELKFKFIRNFNDSIIDNLTDNFSYNSLDNTITVTSEVYDVGTISSFINVNDEYETVCTHQGATLPDITVLTPVERYEESYSNALFDNEVTYAEYVVTSGEIDTAVRYFIHAADTLAIYTTKAIDISAIIPMKEDNVIVDNSNNLSRMLKKLNLSQDQLIESLENPDMDSAYIMTGLNTTIDNNTHNKVMFNTFDLISSGNGNMTVAISQLSMRYSFNVVKSTVTGNIAPVGTYIRTGLNSNGITLQYQGSSTEYQELIISDYIHRYVISGQILETNFTSNTTRIVLPLTIFNSLKYREWVEIYENSLCMLGYSVEVVEIKWYETGAFGFLLQIIAIVFTVATLVSDGGSLLAAVQALAINYAVVEVALYLAEAIGGEFGALVAAAITVYIASQYGDTKGTSGSELWLKSAYKGLTTVSQALTIEAKAELEVLQDQVSDIEDKLKDIKEKIEEQEDNSSLYATNTLPFQSLGYSNPVFQTTSQYVDSIVNTEWLVDGDWLYNIEREINSRNKVYVG